MTQHTHTQYQNRTPETTSTGRRRFAALRTPLGDDRGISEVLGAILMFALLFAVLVLIQVNAVPAENQQVEFEHNQRAQQDMIALNTAILQAATEDVPTSTQVELSARYPSRFFLLNPGVGAGAVETTESGSLTIANAQAPSASNYWDGTDRSFDTKFIRYRPNYNEYRNAPNTVYENGMLLNEFESGATVPVDSRSFIDGDQVTLVLIDGQLATASTSAVAVETTPLSAPARSMTIENTTGEYVTLSLPTTLTESEWDEILEDQTVANGGNVRNVQVSTGTPYNTLTVTLEQGRYELRMGRVGIGSQTDGSVLGPYYLAAASEEVSRTIRTGETREVTVQVNDRYNNPAEGDVEFTSPNGEFRQDDGTYVDSITKTSREDGEVSVIFRPYTTFTGTTTITAAQDFDGQNGIEDREQTEFSVTVDPIDDSIPENADGVGSINPYSDNTVRLTKIERIGQGTNVQGVNLTLENTGDNPRTISQIRMLFYLSNSGTQADWGEVNGEDRFQRLGNWTNVEQTPQIKIPPRQTETVEITFDRARTQDFFGLGIRYSDTAGNYFIQIP